MQKSRAMPRSGLQTRQVLRRCPPPHRLPRATRDEMKRSEEHTSELQSHVNLVCRLALEKKKRAASTECVLVAQLVLIRSNSARLMALPAKSRPARAHSRSAFEIGRAHV